MKKWKVLKKPILTAVLWLTVLTLVCGTSFAWYIEARDAEAGQATVRSDSHSVSVTGYTAYYAFSTDPQRNVIVENGTINLLSFDSVLGRNENTPLYIVVPVSGSAVENRETLNVTIDYNHLYNFSEEVTNPDTQITRSVVSTYLSNVAQIRGTLRAADDLDYAGLYSLFHGGGVFDVHTFVDYELDESGEIVGNPQKHSVTMTLSNPYEAANTVYLVLELDYNVALSDKLLFNHFGDRMSARLDQEQSLTIAKDITTITVSAS